MLRTAFCVGIALFIGVDMAQAKGNKGGGGKNDAGPVVGTIKSVDVAAGKLTVTVTTKKKGSSERDFTVTDATKIRIEGENPKELKGKDGLKAPDVKEGEARQGHQRFRRRHGNRRRRKLCQEEKEEHVTQVAVSRVAMAF